ncbi:MAG: TauD/TfdA family dioxygenase [Pseudomonadota bacterium]
MQIASLTPDLGAEIFDADPVACSPAAWAEIEAAFARYRLLVFRDVTLTPNEQVAVTRRFGAIMRVPYITHLEEHPDIIAVLKEADEQRIATFGGTWHSDFSFLEAPPKASLLYALELPPSGGDTLWADQARAFETLSPALQDLLLGLDAVQTGWPHGTRGPKRQAGLSRSVKMVRGDPAADREVLHPVVRFHAESSRPALFVNPVYTQRFAGWTEAESAPLLGYLYDHATRADFTCRLRWQPRSLAIWDNRATLHLAINDYDGHRRLLHRTTVAGERPLAARDFVRGVAA